MRRKVHRFRQQKIDGLRRQRRDDRGQSRNDRAALLARAVELEHLSHVHHRWPQTTPRLLEQAFAKAEVKTLPIIVLHSSGLLKVLVAQTGEVPRRGKERQFEQLYQAARRTEGTLLLVIDEAHLLDREALTDLRLLVSSAVEQARQISNIATACLIQAAASNVQRVDESLFQQTTSEFQLL